MGAIAIADYALLSDRHSAALVSRDGSIDWLCFPRFDSPSVFGRLLGDEAGHWSITATGATEVTRRYLERTMVLETTFHTPTGTVTLTDAIAVGTGNRGHELGAGAPHLLLRQATCIDGHVDLAIEFVPRTEYGLGRPVLAAVDGGVVASGDSDVLVLSLPVGMTVKGSSGAGEMRLDKGESAGFALHHAPSAQRERAKVWSQSDIRARHRRHRFVVGIVV